MSAKTLLVIPARGGSAGIPRKAVRLLGTKPPLRWTIETCQQLAGDIVVVTDDPEIRALATDVRVLPEPSGCSGQRTLDHVVDATVQACEATHGSYETIATVQCTSPFLSVATIQTCLTALRTHASSLTVRDDRHLRLGGPWVIRQAMPPCWRVTGGCIATRRAYVTPTRRFHMADTQPIVVSGSEALDLDTMEDWAVAEMYAGLTVREQVLTRVLAEEGPLIADRVVSLSCWDEGPAERRARAARTTTWAATCRQPPLELHGTNTYAEAMQFLGTHRPEERDVTLVTSAYHQVRAFLTFVAVLMEWGLDHSVRLWNAPAPSPMDKLAGEWEKITAYQAKGHVASYEAGLAYLQWRDAGCAIS